MALARASLGLSTVAATGAYSDLSGLPTIPSAPSNLTQEQAEDDASTDFGLVSGQRIAQAITAFDPALRPPDYAATVAGAFPAANATVRLTHGLGAKPRRFEFYAICLSASNGHAAGDELTISSDYSQVVSTAVTATEVKLLMRNSIFFSTEDSSATFSPHGNSDWQLGVRAWR